MSTMKHQCGLDHGPGWPDLLGLMDGKHVCFNRKVRVGNLNNAFRSFVSDTLAFENEEVDLSGFVFWQFNEMADWDKRTVAAFLIEAKHRTTGGKMDAAVIFKKTKFMGWQPEVWTKFAPCDKKKFLGPGEPKLDPKIFVREGTTVRRL